MSSPVTLSLDPLTQFYFLIGHRGVGKTHYLKHLQNLYNKKKHKAIFLDLDREIEKKCSLSISEIFQIKGESEFRKIEEETLFSIYHQYRVDSESDIFLAVGAGYKGDFPQESQVLFLQRPTDSSGRCFLHRPRIFPEMSLYDESILLYEGRHQNFLKKSTDQIIKSEDILVKNLGLELDSSLNKPCINPDSSSQFLLESIYFFKETFSCSFGYTLLPEHFKNFSSFLSRRKNWSLNFYELRLDLLNENQLSESVRSLPKSKILLSLRKKGDIQRLEKIISKSSSALPFWGIDIEASLLPDVSLHSLRNIFSHCILSHHGENADIFLKVDPIEEWHWKWSPIVMNWNDLELHHQWWKSKSESRSFLPRSAQGRWSWYRRLFADQMLLSFFREGEGSASDQPILEDLLRDQNILSDQVSAKDFNNKKFAAVIGSPVIASFSPSFHYDFFKNYKMSIFSIDIEKDELDKNSLDFLFSLGLKAAAITSPLKVKISEAIKSEANIISEKEFRVHKRPKHCNESKNNNSYNTLVVDIHGLIHLANTDIEGFKVLIGEISSHQRVAIWGGGGTQNIMKEICPWGHFYSARKGASAVEKNNQYDFLIWSVPQKVMRGCQWPPSSWRPHTVIDLNYIENSPGIEYARSVSAAYKPGVSMFISQALEQQKIWKKYLGRVDHSSGDRR